MPSIDDLWKRCKLKSDEQARQEIISHYAYLARYVVDRLLLRPTSALGYEDLVGHAVVGLIDAVDRFDLSKNVKFETYAVVRIRGTVLDTIKSLDWTPRSVRASEQDIRRAFAEVEARVGRAATDEEVAEELGITVDALNDSIADVGQSSLLSLEELIVATDDGSRFKGIGVSDPQDPLDATALVERTRLLAQAIESLPDREKLVISLYYKEELTLKEIAAVLGVTESRVSQLHSKAVVRLHGKLARHQDLLLAAA